jgi:hypothetical protein
MIPDRDIKRTRVWDRGEGQKRALLLKAKDSHRDVRTVACIPLVVLYRALSGRGKTKKIDGMSRW